MFLYTRKQVTWPRQKCSVELFPDKNKCVGLFAVQSDSFHFALLNGKMKVCVDNYVCWFKFLFVTVTCILNVNIKFYQKGSLLQLVSHKNTRRWNMRGIFKMRLVTVCDLNINTAWPRLDPTHLVSQSVLFPSAPHTPVSPGHGCSQSFPLLGWASYQSHLWHHFDSSQGPSSLVKYGTCHMSTPPSEEVTTPQWPSHSLLPGFLYACLCFPSFLFPLFFCVAYITEGRQSLCTLPLAKYEQLCLKSNYCIHTVLSL